MREVFTVTGVAVLAAMALVAGQGAQAANESLWEASRAGDTTRITAALARGADVNAKSRYDVTPLIFAAGNGRLEAVKLLLSRGAEVNAQDTFYRARAADMALANGYAEVAVFLVQNGSDADSALAAGVQGNNEALVKAALGREGHASGLQSAMSMAGVMKREALIPIIKGVLDKLPAEAAPSIALNPATLPKFVGTYRDSSSGLNTATVTLEPWSLLLQVSQPKWASYRPRKTCSVSRKSMRRSRSTNEAVWSSQSVSYKALQPHPRTYRAGTAAIEAGIPLAAAETHQPPSVRRRPSPRAVLVTGPPFGGDRAAANGDGQRAVTEWDVSNWKKHQVEYRDSGDRHFESCRLGRSRICRYGDQQGR